MMLPPRPWAIICPPTACATRNIPSTFTDMIRRHSSSVYLSKGAKNASRSWDFDAALLCSTSMPPSSSTTRSTIARTEAGSETSQATPMARLPYARRSSAAAASTFCGSRSTTATSAPNSASPRQKCVPRMPTPPVTTATLPLRSNSRLYTHVLHVHGRSGSQGAPAGDQQPNGRQRVLRVDHGALAAGGPGEAVHQAPEHAEVVGHLVRRDAFGAVELEAEAAAHVAQSVHLQQRAVVQLDGDGLVRRAERRHTHGARGRHPQHAVEQVHAVTLPVVEDRASQQLHATV